MKRRFVILNEVKNLIGSMSSVGEILRLHLRMTLRHSLLVRSLSPEGFPTSGNDILLMYLLVTHIVHKLEGERRTW